jgi:hypothetical protein
MTNNEAKSVLIGMLDGREAHGLSSTQLEAIYTALSSLQSIDNVRGLLLRKKRGEWGSKIVYETIAGGELAELVTMTP